MTKPEVIELMNGLNNGITHQHGLEDFKRIHVKNQIHTDAAGRVGEAWYRYFLKCYGSKLVTKRGKQFAAILHIVKQCMNQ